MGCGTGHRELAWARTSKFSSIDAYYLSEARIRTAKARACEAGVADTINFQVGDVYAIAPDKRYDVVFGEQSLHHFSLLEDRLLASGDIKSDYMVAVYKKKLPPIDRLIPCLMSSCAESGSNA